MKLIHSDGVVRTVAACQYPTLSALPRAKSKSKTITVQHKIETEDDDTNAENVQFDGEGWQAYTKQNAGNVTSFLGNFNIPAAPTSYNGQTLFFFTGMQNIDWVPPETRPSESFDIIQPVAQYGPSSAGGGNFWSMASWYVTLGLGTVYSKVVSPIS